MYQPVLYEPVSSWSLPEHLFMVSEWSAFCTNPLDPQSCTNIIQSPNPDTVTSLGSPNDGQQHYAWTDLTYLLHRAGVSWGYYVFQGTEPDWESDSAVTCTPVTQGPKTPGIWNPLPSFTDVAQDGQLGNSNHLTISSRPPRAARCRRVVDRSQRHRIRAPSLAGKQKVKPI